MMMYEVMNSKLSEEENLDVNDVVQEIEEVISEFQLKVTQKTTLSKMPGSIHYHLKKGNVAGVLEVTYWPKKKSLIVDIHDNRLKEWNMELILPFSEALAKRFSGVVQPKV
ncbi:hypothetical protein [Bacillus horti]|uniref:Uncharacterized protein n=1 Tax=Caldalkalibacillus horti TaxID=77523 RepID=A0ABT9W0Q7_9BACI|nr:hypothetical protein [Bacillus horti]MDQ0166818.1 hypothetical protein [Bacillus horti]